MDFFDSALDKAKEAIEIVSKKTEEVVSVQKQKYNIAALKHKNAKCFESLGEIYFEQICGTYIDDDEIKDLVDLIIENNTQIETLEAKIDKEAQK